MKIPIVIFMFLCWKIYHGCQKHINRSRDEIVLFSIRNQLDQRNVSIVRKKETQVYY